MIPCAVACTRAAARSASSSPDWAISSRPNSGPATAASSSSVVVAVLSRASRWLTTSRTPSGLPSWASAWASRRSPVVDRHDLAFQHRAPELGHEEGVAAGQLAHDPCDLRHIRHRVADRALDELGDLLSAQTSEPQPYHSLGAAKIDERRRQRLRHLGLGVTEGRDEERASIGCPARQVAQEQERGRVGPVAVLDHHHQRRATTRRGEEVADGAVQPVALGVRVGRHRRRQLTDPARQIWQEPRELAAVRAQRGLQCGLIDASHELPDRVDERPVRTPHLGVARAVEHERPGRRGIVRELADEPALARPGLASHERESQTLPVHAGHQRTQRRELAGAPRERKRRSQAKRSRELAHHGGWGPIVRSDHATRCNPVRKWVKPRHDGPPLVAYVAAGALRPHWPPTPGSNT